MRMVRLRNSQGMVLILALWALGMMSIFVISIGVQLRQKIDVVSRLERREELYWLARSGIEKGKFVFSQAHKLSEDNQPLPRSWQRLRWLNNPRAFHHVKMGNGFFELRYDYIDEEQGAVRTLYGFIDEERKININRANVPILSRLIESVLTVDAEEARSLAQSVMDWRIYGESEIVGFFSDEYYDNLEFPYPEKKGDFENIMELTLLKGWTAEVYQHLEPYLTIYGNGQVNVNTASAPVLRALGLPENFIQTLLSVRRGPDGKDWTGDDIVFQNLPEMMTVLMSFETLTPDDIRVINDLSAQGWLGTQSSYYRIDTYAEIISSGEKKKISCVFFAPTRQILYWRES